MIEKKDPTQKNVAVKSSDDDPIIELTDEITTKPEDNRKPESPIDDDVMPPKADRDPSFRDDMPADIEFEDEEDQDIIPFTELDKDDAKADDDIIEIAEFDQHYPYDDDETLDHGSLLDPADLEDKDFIELFDIEEDGSIEDEEIKELSEAEEKAVEAELSRFFEDALEDETGDENNTHPPVEKFSERDTDLNLSTTAAALLSGAGKIDRPATLPTQDPTKKEPASNAGNTKVVSPEQIDQAIERIVNEKLAGRVEHIIYEVIEKAVKREIERLKASLLGDSTPENHR